MHYRIFSILVTFVCLFGCALTTAAQDVNNTDETEKPVILYSGTPKKYEIADIKVEGAQNYEDYVIVGLSGLSKGQTITVPGDEITQACKRYWRHGLFSDVEITADKIEGDQIWLTIHLTMRPRVSDIRYNGVKKSEREDLESRIGMIKGGQITPNLVDRAKTLIKRYFDDKGFKNADVIITQRDDPEKKNEVIVNIDIDKKEKVKVHQITIVGNEALTTKKLKRVMKKTNEKGKLLNLFRTKKFIEDNYEADKQLIIDKYNELGYRDAIIVTDSIKPYDDRTVDIFMQIEEGQKYYLRNVTWVGNTLYPSEQLNFLLQMKKGDVYNQKLLEERTMTDDDAIGPRDRRVEDRQEQSADFEQGDASEPQQPEADDLHDRRRARGESARRQAGDRHAYREGAAGPQEGRPCGRGGSGRHDPFRDPRHQHLNRPAFSGGVRFPRGVPDRTYTLICRYFCRGRLSRSLFFVSSPP